MALDLENFYIIISPEQDYTGKIIINRKYGKLRNWYFCSQEFDENNELDRQVLEIANVARIEALAEAYQDCGYKKEFQISKPKSCNEKAARRYMTGKIVIVLDNFNLKEKTCDIHSSLLCKGIDDDPRVWKRIKWGRKKKFYKPRRKNYKKQSAGFNKLSEQIPEAIKDNLKVSSQK